MKVVLTDAAVADLIRIGWFIREDNPARAVTFVAELEERCRNLETAPHAYPLLPSHESAGIRRRPYRDYLIFYRVNEAGGVIEILHVLHGARDYEEVLFPGG